VKLKPNKKLPPMCVVGDALLTGAHDTMISIHSLFFSLQEQVIAEHHLPQQDKERMHKFFFHFFSLGNSVEEQEIKCANKQVPWIEGSKREG
jgi:hypothetical protein